MRRGRKKIGVDYPELQLSNQDTAEINNNTNKNLPQFL